MDRYEYQLGENSNGKGFISYHVKLGNGEKVILEVGPESVRNRKNLPKGVKSCKNAGFGQNMVDRINSKKLKVYIVRKNGKRYNFSPVGIASYSKETEQQISLRTKTYNFTYNRTTNTTGQDLANSASQSEVYLEGSDPYICETSYLFRKIPRLVCYAYTDIVYVPGVGVIEERTGRTVEEAKSNRLKLIRVNDQTFDQYYATVVCPAPKIQEPAIVMDTPPPPSTPVPTEYTERSPVVSYGWIARNNPPEVFQERAPETNAILLDKIGERRIEFVPADPEYGLIAPAKEETPIEYVYTEKTVTTAIPRPCGEMSAEGIHVVQREETLYGISRQYGASVDQLRVWNKLGNQDMIHPCMKLYTIPPSTFTNPTAVQATPEDLGNCAETSFPGVHIVQKGEILYAIGRKYGLGISDLRKWNDLDNVNSLSPCMRIATAQPEEVVDVTPSPVQIIDFGTTEVDSNAPTYDDLVAKGSTVPGVYVVKRGETLYQIARANNISVENLRNWNNLGNAPLQPGQTLYTLQPAASATPQPYNNVAALAPRTIVVKRGETLSDIAKQYNVAMVDLKDWNNLKNIHQLSPGQVLYIVQPAPVAYDNTLTSKNVAALAPGTIMVKKGETLSDISKTYNVTMVDLKDWNNLKNIHQLSPGQILYIVQPTPVAYTNTVPLKVDNNVKITCLESSRPGLHVVQQGETLYQIAQLHGLTLMQLKGWNNLKDKDVLTPCTKLLTRSPKGTVPTSYDTAKSKITCKNKSSKGVHIVQNGETLYQLAKKYKVSVENLQAWNALGSSTYLAPCASLYTTKPRSYVNVKPTKKASPAPKQPTPAKAIVKAQPKPQAAPPRVITKTKIICEQSSRPGVHIVQQGETLAKIARTHKVTARQLQIWNGLGAQDIIQACQALATRPPANYDVVVQTQPTRAVPQAQPAPQEFVTKTVTTQRIIHIVKQGESLASIANLYNISVGDILVFNTLPNDAIIYVGQRLYASPEIPANGIQKSSTPTTASSATLPAVLNTPAPAATPPNYNTSTQRIESVAPNTTVTTFVPTESFTSRGGEPVTYETTVSVGQKRVHVVKDGESIESIAKMYGIAPARIRSINLMDEKDVVIPFQKIYLQK